METGVIAVEQTTSAGFAAGPVTVDYPSGIAVDDLMVLFLFCSELDAINTPAGWTVISDSTAAFGGDVDTDVYVYQKVVDAGDVSAGSVSVNVVDAAGDIAYTCYRISGYDPATQIEQLDTGDDLTTGTARSHAVSITPSFETGLLLVAGGYDGQGTTSGYAATGSPTFTEVLDAQRSTTDTISVSHATTASDSEITDISFTSSVSTTRSQVIAFIVRSRVNVVATVDRVDASPVVYEVTGAAGVTATLELVEANPVVREVSATGTIQSWSDIQKSVALGTDYSLDIGGGYTLDIGDGYSLLIGGSPEDDPWTEINKS